ncbi:lipopolysaccharide biosynthesis protein [Mucilaginibacter phyllosphaerae]|uniref:O-antigen/teichoic acid export membrane protein n=1 Tax=Mucilaginibacter phyllosphaerae TaxID=1812349 RepID=A0A4Y8A7Z8_9SPHI|nr:oligosaccharide flippase family protein [Mucilaginibacter phyllosphaerae]MBB3970518.1 O-antigen/teichoic acid export membrane protein [Mucilaginibacter phyllosphaerae]TEW64532.1 polysaccharide biosynthesis protein [Mucilaginibacter phyllosphaerae]GGH19284.1 O-antigen export protein [Mucilaginibacter phyllosphaerae]
MIQAIQSNIYNFLNRGHQRSVRLKKNIIFSVFLKGGSVVISLVLIPLTIGYVNPTQYGIWLTLSSVIAWAAFFDIGLGNGLKNKLAAAIAMGDYTRARSYVSTTYVLLGGIAVILFAVFYLLNPYINWQQILNAPQTAGLNRLALMMFGFFCLQFVVQLINIVLTANQQPAISSLLNVVGQALMLLAIFVLTRVTQGSLINLLLVMAGMPLIVLAVASLWLYKASYKLMAPSLALVNLKYTREMLGSGSAFLVIQLGALVLFETDNIVITQLFGPQEVTTFNIAYKLFSVILMLFTIIITPFWSAFTEAYTKQDYSWIKTTMQKIHKVWVALSCVTLLMLALSPLLYNLWLGHKVSVPLSLSVSMCVYIIASLWQIIHVYLLNGVGKIRLQLYLVLGSALINIPLAVFLGKQIGLAGVTLSNALLFIVMGAIFSIQTKKIINGTAKGIFNT